jgi:hypothetical protein
MGGHNAHMEEIKYIHNFDFGGLKGRVHLEGQGTDKILLK